MKPFMMLDTRYGVTKDAKTGLIVEWKEVPMTAKQSLFTADLFKSLEISTHGAENCAAIANAKAAPLQAEIERLRAELAQCEKDRDEHELGHGRCAKAASDLRIENHQLRARVADLERENGQTSRLLGYHVEEVARLRGALEEIARVGYTGAAYVARAALAGGKEGA
jgi:chromosome segregation ATPase